MNKKTFKSIFRNTAISQIFACLVACVANTVDASVTGTFLGGDEVAAIGYTLPLIYFYLALSTLLSFGAELQSSKYIGEGNTKKANGQFTLAIVMIFVVSFLLVVIFNIFSRELAVMLGAEGEHMIQLTADYLIGLSYGIFPIYLFVFLTPLCNIDGNTVLPIISVTVLIVTDIVFDLTNAVIVKGGIYGMGVASSMSYLVSSIIIMMHLFSKKCSFKFRIKNIQASMIGKTLVSGLPSSIQSIGLACLALLINHILTDGNSTTAVATFSIAYCIVTLVLSIPNGLAPAVISFTGVFFGEEDDKSLKLLQKEALKISIVWNLAAFIILFIVRKPFVMLFTNEQAIINMAMIAVPLLATQLIFFGIDICFQNYLMVIGNEKLIILMSFLSNFVFCAICALGFSNLIGINGIWLCYTGGKLISLIVLFVIAIIKNGSFPKTSDDWLLLPESYGKNKISETSFIIKNKDEVMSASKNVWKFCTENNAENRIRFFFSLFVEEIGNNSVTYGFSDNKKKENQLDIYLSKYTDCWKLRIRDNGKLFNPLKYFELQNDNDLEHNIGIKIVTGMADDIQYLNTFNLNNIILTIKSEN